MQRANKLSKLNQSIYIVKNTQDVNEKKICWYGTVFIATKHEKIIMAVHFELLASNTMKNETGEKFRNILGINLVKYSSEFLAHIKNIYVIQAHQQVFQIFA